MGSRTRASTTTKKAALKKHKAELDRLPGREAQVLRMRHGITEPDSSPVGRPAREVSAELRERLLAVEEEIFERIRAAAQAAEPADAKGKIVSALKDKSPKGKSPKKKK